MDGTMDKKKLTCRVKRLSRLDLPGAGQVYVDGKYAYVGHIPGKQQLGTSILDVSDPANPKIASQIFLDDPTSHSHKVRVIGDLMIVNSERNMTAIGRKADELPRLRTELRAQFGREADNGELAAALGVGVEEIPAVEEAQKKPYDSGGFKLYDVSDRSKPKFIHFQKTHGIGVHRFDMDANYAYISTEWPGYKGNILVTYDIRKPAKPTEVSVWWIPGQHIAGGEKPSWPGRQHRLHHTVRVGDRIYAGCWHGGCASSMPRTSQSHIPSVPITTTRRSRSPHTHSWACPSPSTAARSPWRSTRKITRTARRRCCAVAVARTAVYGPSTSPTPPISSRWQYSRLVNSIRPGAVPPPGVSAGISSRNT